MPSPPSSEIATQPRLNLVQRLALEKRCLELRLAGHTIEDIAESLEIKIGEAKKLVNRALAKDMAVDEEYVAAYRALTIQRTEKMINAVFGQAVGEEPRLITTVTGEEVAIKSPSYEGIKVVRLLNRDLIDLVGMEAPKKTEATITTNDPVKQQVLDLLRKRDEAERDQYQAGGSVITGSIVQGALGTASEAEPTDSSGDLVE